MLRRAAPAIAEIRANRRDAVGARGENIDEPAARAVDARQHAFAGQRAGNGEGAVRRPRQPLAAIAEAVDRNLLDGAVHP